jgi:hypothetical protein
MLLRQVCVRAARTARGSVALGLVVGSTVAVLAASPAGAADDPTDPPVVVTPTPTPDPTDPGSAPAPTTSEPAPPATTPTDVPTSPAPPDPTSAPPSGSDAPTSAPGSSAPPPTGPTTPAAPTTGAPPPAAGGNADPVVDAHPAVVTMSAFDAVNFVFKGTRQVRTATGTLPVLWFQAARAHAAAYRLRSAATGPAVGLGGDMDLAAVDVYATRFSGTVAVPALNIPLAPITLTPDSVPTWLAVDLVLPAFNAQDVTLEQAFISAGSLTGNNISVTAPH